MKSGKFTRRDVLKLAPAAFAVPYLVPGDVLAAPGKPGANDRVKVGIIGLGGRARSVAKTCKPIPEMRIAAICDCFAPLCDKFIKLVGEGQNWNAYTDFRQMCDKEKLDGVMVETTTHARAWVAIQAMQAGADTYIEKPMCLTIAEGRYMAEAARRYKRVTQVGTQQRSSPLSNWGSDLIKNGAIGKIKTVLAPDFVGPVRWTPAPAQPMPTGGSAKWWDIWTNQAELRPYHRGLHRGWMKWWAYDGGGRCFGVTGWGAHTYDQINRALGTDETGPVEVLLEEPVATRPCGRFDAIDETDPAAGLIRLAKPVVGPRAKVRMRFDTGTELRLHLDGDWGPGLGGIFVGEKGKIELNRDNVASNPKEITNSPDNPRPSKANNTRLHVEDWLRCIKSRERCAADIEYGQRSHTLCYLVNIVRAVGQVGKKFHWDPKTERFTDCDEGNKLLSRPRRKGYELPKLT